MGGKLGAEQMGVAAGDIEVITLAGETVDKELPFWEILDLIKEQGLRLVIERIYSSKDLIIVSEPGQPFVIKADIPGVFNLRELVDCKERFSCTPRPYDHLDKRAFPPRDLSITGDVQFLYHTLQVAFLDKNDIADSQKSHILITIVIKNR